MEENKLQFLAALVGGDLGEQATAFVEESGRRSEAVGRVLEVLTPEKKRDLRERLTHQVVDHSGAVKGQSHHEDGQEYEVDTFQSTRKGLSIVGSQSSTVTEAYAEIVLLVKQLTEARDDKGNLVFPPVTQGDALLPHPDLAQTIIDEVFTPLVREGVLPENLVPDAYSETQRLLEATYKAYRGSLREKEEEEEEEISEAIAGYHGAEGAGGRLKAMKVLFNRNKEQMLKSRGVSPSTVRRAEIGVEVAKLGGRFKTAAVENERYWSANALSEAEERMGLRSRDPIDLAETDEEKEKEKTLWGLKIAKNSVVGLGTTVKDSVKLGLDSDKLHKARELEVPESLLVRIREAEEALDAMEKAVDGQWTALGQNGAETLEGLFGRYLPRDEIVAEVLDAKPEGADIIELIAAALEETCTVGLGPALKAYPEPQPQEPPLNGLGASLAKALRSRASGVRLRKAINEGEDDPWSAEVEAVKGALAAVFTQPVCERLAERFTDPTFAVAVAGATAVPDKEAALENFKAAEAEIDEFEQQLTLIDEVGESGAGRQNIEVLIQQLKKDQAALKVAADVGKVLRSSGVGIGKVVTQAVNATGEVTAQVLGPFKAAQLLIQLSVNIVKAVERIRLFHAFGKKLKEARVARSPLTSTIEGLFNNKQEQVTFQMIEDVLIAVQIAANIVSTVPEPITYAVGKSLGVTAALLKQANKVARKVYSEVQLTRAWNTTREALNNPKDRATGLKALRLNPTLGIHALAWAATDQRDPMARMVMDAIGLTEEGLEAGANEGKVREYLVTVLYEDRSLLDPRELSVKWAPETFEATAADWFVITQRAAAKAVPPLALGPEKAVTAALQAVEAAQEKVASHGQEPVPEEDRLALIQAFEAAAEALQAYMPRDPSGGDHDEMASLVAELLKKLRLTRIAAGVGP